MIEDSTPASIPKPILLGALLLVLAGLIPAMIVLNMRAGFSDLPRWHVWFDMDFQPKKKPQQTTTVFADGRSMRPQVVGTVARGQLTEQDPFYTGLDPSKQAAIQESVGALVSFQTSSSISADSGQPPTDGQAASSAGTVGTDPPKPYVTELPIEANEEHMKLGKTKYEIYCSACHGYSGFGDGLVAARAQALQQDTWTAPTSLHADRVQKQPFGQIFHTITNGQNKMAPYSTSLTPKERWAVVLYVKALQRSRNASIEDVPVEERTKLTPAP